MVEKTPKPKNSSRNQNKALDIIKNLARIVTRQSNSDNENFRYT